MQIHFTRSNRERKPTSQYRGVNWDKQYGKWKATISVNDRKKILGHFVSEIEAARAFNLEAVKYGRPLNDLP
jgi:hypothetical protein